MSNLTSIEILNKISAIQNELKCSEMEAEAEARRRDEAWKSCECVPREEIPDDVRNGNLPIEM